MSVPPPTPPPPQVPLAERLKASATHSARALGLVWRSAPGGVLVLAAVHDRRGGAAAVRRLRRQADHRRGDRGARGAARGSRARRRSRTPCGWSASSSAAVVVMAGAERVLGSGAPAGRAAAGHRSQRADPGEGAAARAAAVRGSRVLRQADARAARGLDAAAVVDSEQLPGRPQRADAGRLRGAADSLFALDGAGGAGGDGAGVHRRGALLGRGVPAAQLALARLAAAHLPRVRAGQRRARQGGEAVRPRAAAARALPAAGRVVLRRRSAAGDRTRRLGLRAVAAQHGRVLRLLRADRRRRRCAAGCRWAT